MKIGIGICTYNRLDQLRAVLQNILENTPESYDLFVSDDGSTDGLTIPWLRLSGIEFMTSQNKGVVYSKNRIINRFRDYDYIFIVEDDIEIFKPGWVSLHIDALERSKTHHLNFIPHIQVGPDVDPRMIGVLETEELPNCTIYSCARLCGVLMTLTREAIEVCGGLDFRFRGYGFGHGEYTERIHRAGLTRFQYPSIKESSEYIGLLPVAHVLTRERIKSSIKLNERIAKICQRDPSLWRPYNLTDAGKYALYVLPE